VTAWTKPGKGDASLLSEFRHGKERGGCTDGCRTIKSTPQGGGKERIEGKDAGIGQPQIREKGPGEINPKPHASEDQDCTSEERQPKKVKAAFAEVDNDLIKGYQQKATRSNLGLAL